MSQKSKHDAWNAGEAYDAYMGRWSRRIAEDFLAWLNPDPGLGWLDVGCGTGALTEIILRRAAPRSVRAVDPSDGFVSYAAANILDPRVKFRAGSATALPFDSGRFEALASGLVLNFIDNQRAALREFCRVLEPGGLLSFYVWDYPGGGMGVIDTFWAAARALDPGAAELDESRRFPGSTKDGLAALCAGAGLAGAEVTALETTSDFPDFVTFWAPFTLGAGPAPGYCKSLPPERQAALKDELRRRLGSGPISLPARAWAVKARIPG